MKWAEYVARMGEMTGAYRDLMGRPGGKSQLGMPRLGWKENIKIDLQAVGWGGIDWIDLAHDRNGDGFLWIR
jgi:hypothetical protein